MKRAWEIFRSEKVTFSYTLSKSWREVKFPDLFAAMKAMDKIMADNKAKKPYICAKWHFNKRKKEIFEILKK